MRASADLTQAEGQQLLMRWNNTAAQYPRDKCVHDLFAAQVARTPEALAVSCQDRSLTYAELDWRANQLAHHLRNLGVGPEVVVALCVERSPAMVVALLGILKAGGAYLPLDPSYPQQRLAYMLADAGAPVLVMQAALAKALPLNAARLVLIDADAEQIARQPTTAPASGTQPGNLIYVMYTSGSTGMPKGVMITHGGIVNRLAWMDHAYRLQPYDRVLQKTPFSFDVSVWELFWPLITGAALVMARPGGHRDNEYLVRLVAEQNITVLHFVPSMLRLFLQTKGLERCGSVREIVCSGEALSPDLVEEFAAKLTGRLHNLYGPTEASVDVSFWACDPSSGTVAIGRPIWNTQLHVLDEGLEPVPIGAAGELWIAGAGLARGYRGRTARTAERFVPSPFGDGERLYRTGDLARWRADGELEFLGRVDQQIKLRGYRIELGEVEATLAAHPAIQAAVVIAVDRGPTDRVLVAYLMRRAGQRTLAAELDAYVREKLPAYMVPSAFRIVDALPLGPNGKVDRTALVLIETADAADLEDILTEFERASGEQIASRGDQLRATEHA